MARNWVARLRQRTWWADPPPPPRTSLWVSWEELLTQFSFWNFIAGGLAPGRTRWTAIDDMSRVRVKPRVVAALARLEALEAPVLDQLAALARANLDRHSYFSRLLLLAYFTIPLTIGAMAAQLAPGWLTATLQANAPAFGGGFAGAAVAVVIRLMAEARARQIVTIIDLARIERGQCDTRH